VAGGVALRRRSLVNTDIYPSARVLRAIAASRPDAIVSGGWSFPTLYAAIYGAAARAPLVVQSDGTGHSERALNGAQVISRRVLVPVAAAFVANSAASRRRFVELGADPARVFLAPHTTDIAPYREAAGRRFARTDAGSARQGGAVTVLCVGRLLPSKGLDLLVSAAAQAARHTGAPIRVMLVGSGPEESRLRTLAQDLGVPLEIRAFVEQSGLPAIYEAADVFAFPTLSDTFGIVLLEAAASGLPLVASPFAGATEDLVRDGAGSVVDPRDTQRFAAALADLAGDVDRRLEAGRRAHAGTTGRTPARAADGYLEAVAAALGPRRAR
jgi:glycosyltransferase involved in cell wall biosynthesis